MKTRERISNIFATEYKASDVGGQRIIEGYASVFNVVDSWKDIILQGAFTKTIQENAQRVKLLYQHDLTCPIGKIDMMSEDSKGLQFKATISNTMMGNEAYTLVKDGILDEVSIGFESIKDEYVENVRMISELRLWEISLVTLAANSYSKITDIKSHENTFLLNKILELTKKYDNIESNIEELKALVKQDKPHKSQSNPNVDEIDWNQLLLELKNK